MKNDTLGDRQKYYEDCYRIKLPRRVPKIIRIDGKAFHSLLSLAEKPYDPFVMTAMVNGATAVLNEIGGTARFAYLQSDECTIAINDALEYDTQPWFDNNIQKMVSVAASVFANSFGSSWSNKGAFDARVFVLPDVQEVVNNIIWRQNDATRNSIQQYGRFYFSHKEMDGKSNEEVQEMMFKSHGFNWNDAPTWTKRGVIVTREHFDTDIPKFTENRGFIINLFDRVIENENRTS